MDLLKHILDALHNPEQPAQTDDAAAGTAGRVRNTLTRFGKALLNSMKQHKLIWIIAGSALLAILLITGSVLLFMGRMPSASRVMDDLAFYIPDSLGEVVEMEVVSQDVYNNAQHNTVKLVCDTELRRTEWRVSVSYSKRHSLRYQMDHEPRDYDFEKGVSRPLAPVQPKEVEAFLESAIICDSKTKRPLLDGELKDHSFTVTEQRLEDGLCRASVTMSFDFAMSTGEATQTIGFEYDANSDSWVSRDKIMLELRPSVELTEELFSTMLKGSGLRLCEDGSVALPDTDLKGREVRFSLDDTPFTCTVSEITAQSEPGHYLVTCSLAIRSGFTDSIVDLMIRVGFDSAKGYVLEDGDNSFCQYIGLTFPALDEMRFSGTYKGKSSLPFPKKDGSITLDKFTVTDSKNLTVEGTVSGKPLTFAGTFDPATGNVGTLQSTSALPVDLVFAFGISASSQVTVALDLGVLSPDQKHISGTIRFTGYLEYGDFHSLMGKADLDTVSTSFDLNAY